MKVLVQRLRDGKPQLLETALPIAGPGQVLIQTRATVVSRGTETLLLQFGRGNWLQKARQQPEQVRQALQKIRRDGFGSAWKAVQRKLDTPVPMGYCQAGVVIGVGAGVSGFQAGDRVVSNGPHAEVVRVPANLVALIPEQLPFEEAAFAPLAAIALHGIRLAAPTLGETVAVVGLGLVGTLAAQLLKAHGCRVVGIDPEPAARQRAEALGIGVLPAATDPEAYLKGQTGGWGADAVLICTASGDAGPVRLAAQLARAKGRLVLIGTADVHFDRTLLFRKELSFVVSSSYGPGRYDPAYEVRQQDYPLPHVRWTAGRNFAAVLGAMAAGTLQVAPLIGLRTALEDFEQVYAPQPAYPGTAVFQFPAQEISGHSFEIHSGITTPAAAGIGFIGAGEFARQVLVPVVKAHGGNLYAICSATGVSAAMAARKFGIPHLSADYAELLQSPAIGQVFVATRHDSHAAITCAALESGKHVFVEKPLALSAEDLRRVAVAQEHSGRVLTVGFNRRFAPLTAKLQAAFPPSPDWHLTYTINAGMLPPDHWTTDPESGGGRLLGEVCHFIDLAIFLSGAGLRQVFCAGRETEKGCETYAITLSFDNGSTATIQYLTGGNSRFPKEQLAVHSLGKSAVLDNWRRLTILSPTGIKKHRTAQDKGHSTLIRAHLDAVAGKAAPPLSMAALIATTAATLAAQQSLNNGAPAPVSGPGI